MIVSIFGYLWIWQFMKNGYDCRLDEDWDNV